MIDFEVKGAIFDFDDTLLDNRPYPNDLGLHERARLAAAREVGKLHHIKQLEEQSIEDNLNAFLTAPVHTLESAVWNILRMTGLADSEVVNIDNPVFQQIIDRKNELYVDVLMEHGQEVPGAVKFIQALSTRQPNKLAMATTAIRRDVDLFIGKLGLQDIFPANRIITKESVVHPKPNPEAYDLAFGSLGLPEKTRSAVCAFEDDPRGIMSARAAGLYVCAIGSRYDPDFLLALEFPPHIAVKTYAEFMDQFGLTA